MTTPDNLIKRAQKLARQESFQTLLEAIETRPLSASEQTTFLGRLMAATASGSITPSEARKLTKAVSERRTA